MEIYLLLLVFASTGTLASSLSSTQHQAHPNILFILADDMGQWAAGCYGNYEIYTPNIDKLASEGVRFTDAFCNTPVCSASRATYFTGRLPSQHGIHDWLSGGNGCGQEADDYMMEETFYTDVLSAHGYQCAISGKYHLGDQQVPQHSFQHWFVHQKGGADYNDPPMVKNGECVNIKGYVTDIITDDAIDFLLKEWNSSAPFYLSVHYTAPHNPYTGKDGRADSEHPKAIVDLYQNCSFHTLPQEPKNPYAEHTSTFTDHCLGNRQCLLGYFAAMTAMDQNIGRILQTLTDMGIDEDTLVVFASDHGFNAGQHGLWGKGNSAYPLNMFDTSLKIPLIFRHKNTIKPKVESAVVQVVDIAPTLLEYSGNFAFPHHANIPGHSFASLLTSASTDKLPWATEGAIFGEYGQVRSARSANFKYVSRFTNQLELYDLVNDPKETNNLAANVSSLPVLHAHEVALRDFFSFYEDPFVSGWHFPVTGQGQIHPVLYNSSGESTKPAFVKLAYT